MVDNVKNKQQLESVQIKLDEIGHNFNQIKAEPSEQGKEELFIANLDAKHIIRETTEEDPAARGFRKYKGALRDIIDQDAYQ